MLFLVLPLRGYSKDLNNTCYTVISVLLTDNYVTNTLRKHHICVVIFCMKGGEAGIVAPLALFFAIQSKITHAILACHLSGWHVQEV